MKLKRMIIRGAVLVLALILAGCDKPEDKDLAATPASPPTASEAGDAQPASLELTGTLVYREREALPEDAVITVQLVRAADVDNLAPDGAGGSVVAEHQQAAEGRQVPIPFSFVYRGDTRQAEDDYGLWAEVRDGNGELRWSTLRLHPVPAGKPAPVELLLGKVHSAAERVPAEDVLAE